MTGLSDLFRCVLGRGFHRGTAEVHKERKRSTNSRKTDEACIQNKTSLVSRERKENKSGAAGRQHPFVSSLS